MAEDASRLPTADDGGFEEFFALEFPSLWDSAFLLLGDRDLARTAALDAMLAARAVWAHIDEHERPGLFVRARLAAPARLPRRARASDPAPALHALDACGDRERRALVCRLHDRLPDAEAAVVIGCEPDEVDDLVARGIEQASPVITRLDATSSSSFVDSWLRVMMQRAVEAPTPLGDRDALLAQRWRARTKRRMVQAVGVGALAVAVAAIVVLTASDAEPPELARAADPPVFTDESLGYRLVVAEGWEEQPTLADPRGEGAFDPSRFGFSAVDPADQRAAFRRTMWHESGLLVISVAPTTSYLADVARVRDELGAQQAAQDTVVTAALAEVGGRPATRFRVDHPADATVCPGCRTIIWVAHWYHGTTMTVVFQAFLESSHEPESAYTAFADDVEAMVGSIEEVRGEETLLYAPLAGSAREGLVVDAWTEAVLQLMDARARGAGAELWLSERAARAYEDRDSLSLYDGIEAYQVVARMDRQDGTIAFIVDVASEDGGRRERLVLGAGPNAFGQPWPEVVLAAAPERLGS